MFTLFYLRVKNKKIEYISELSVLRSMKEDEIKKNSTTYQMYLNTVSQSYLFLFLLRKYLSHSDA